MENNLPKHITNEKDLEYFEAFLSDAKSGTNNTHNSLPQQRNANNAPQQKNTNNTQRRNNNQSTSTADALSKFLEDHIGKHVRVDFLIGDRRETKTGKLFKVGKEYIVLKPMQSNTTVVCDIKSIKFITVIHGGNANRR